MSVPLTLLGLLEREPSHGYDLKRDYDAYFGRGKPLPFGQVYATLARLARDGKAIAGPAEPARAPTASATRSPRPASPTSSSGSSEPVPPEPHLQTVLFAKVVLALMLGRPAELLPGRPAGGPPAADARAHRPEAAAARSSTPCSPTMACTTWRPTCDGSTTPRPGSTCWREAVRPVTAPIIEARGV